MLEEKQFAGKGGFLLSLQTVQGVSLVVGGLCTKGAEENCLRGYLALRALQFSGDEDIRALDVQLAEAVSRCAEDSVRVVGASVAAPGYNLRTGGVIGSPHQESESAAGECEMLEENLFLLALPGGPGVALCCERARARLLLNRWTSQPDCSLEQRAEWLCAHHVDDFLIVADGAGEGARGCVILCCEGALQMAETGPPSPKRRVL